MGEDGVIVLHGIFRTHYSMAGLARYIRKQGFKVLNVGYPSTRLTLAEIADHIQPKVDAFAQGITGKLHFVGYSMGGLVIRTFLHRYPQNKLGRVVMIGTPNNGSEVADLVKDWRLYKKLYGPAGQQLGTGPSLLEDRVHYELGIIAGSLSLAPLGSYVIRKPSDGTVSVESTKLIGMKEHIIVSVPHTLFPHSRKTWRLTQRFLETGQFRHS